MLGNYTSPWMTADLTIFKDAASKFMQAEFVPLADKWHKQGMVDRGADLRRAARVRCATEHSGWRRAHACVAWRSRLHESAPLKGAALFAVPARA